MGFGRTLSILILLLTRFNCFNTSAQPFLWTIENIKSKETAGVFADSVIPVKGDQAVASLGSESVVFCKDPFSGFRGRIPYFFRGIKESWAVFSDHKGSFYLSDSAELLKIRFGPFRKILNKEGFLLVQDEHKWRINPGRSDEFTADSISVFDRHFAAHTEQGVAIFQAGKATIFHYLPGGNRIWNASGSFVGINQKWQSVFSKVPPFEVSERFIWWNDSLGLDTAGKGWKKLPYKKKTKPADSLKRLSASFALGMIKNGPFVVTAKGRTIKLKSYKSWKVLSDTLLAIKQEEGWHLISLQGSRFGFHKAVTDILDLNNGFIRIKSGKRFGLADCQGIIRIACRYDSLSPFEGDFCKAKIGQKWGILDRDERLIIQPNFDEILWPQNGFWPLKQGNKWALSAATTYSEAAHVYDSFSPFEPGGWLVKKGNWSGWLGNNGILIIPCRFQMIEALSPTLIKVFRENKVGIFNNFGLPIKELNYKKIVTFAEEPDYLFYY